jgi:DNA-binding MarR family transcriptional regulator
MMGKLSMRETIQPVFKLVSSIRKINDRRLTSKLRLTLSQFRILSVIKKNPKTSQRVIANFWMMTEASISRQIEILRKKKLIEKVWSPENRREHIFRLTSSGLKMLSKANSLIDSMLEKIFADISQKDRKVFSAIINRFLALVPDHDGMNAKNASSKA